jgi:hypothetical protein
VLIPWLCRLVLIIRRSTGARNWHGRTLTVGDEPVLGPLRPPQIPDRFTAWN